MATPKITSAQFEEYKNNPNVQWVLYNILEHESAHFRTGDNKGKVNHGGFNRGSGDSSAFGAGQFLGSTRKSILDKYGIDAWSSDINEQMNAVISLLDASGYLDNVIDGDLSVMGKGLWTAFNVGDRFDNTIGGDKPDGWQKSLETSLNEAVYDPVLSWNNLDPKIRKEKLEMFKSVYWNKKGSKYGDLSEGTLPGNIILNDDGSATGVIQTDTDPIERTNIQGGGVTGSGYITSKQGAALLLRGKYGFTGDLEITSGFRDAKNQARIMWNNWWRESDNGKDLAAGRKYLIGLYKDDDAAAAIANIFESNPTEAGKYEVRKKATEYLKKSPISRHQSGLAIDVVGDFENWLKDGMRETTDPKYNAQAAQYIKDFNLKILQESDHFHITFQENAPIENKDHENHELWNKATTYVDRNQKVNLEDNDYIQIDDEQVIKDLSYDPNDYETSVNERFDAEGIEPPFVPDPIDPINIPKRPVTSIINKDIIPEKITEVDLSTLKATPALLDVINRKDLKEVYKKYKEYKGKDALSFRQWKKEIEKEDPKNLGELIAPVLLDDLEIPELTQEEIEEEDPTEKFDITPEVTEEKEEVINSAFSQGLTADDFKTLFSEKELAYFGLAGKTWNLNENKEESFQSMTFDEYVNTLINQKSDGKYVHTKETIEQAIKTRIENKRKFALMTDDEKRNYLDHLGNEYIKRIKQIDEDLKSEKITDTQRDYLEKMKAYYTETVNKLHTDPNSLDFFNSVTENSIGPAMVMDEDGNYYHIEDGIGGLPKRYQNQHLSQRQINKLLKDGLITPMEEGTFDPNKYIASPTTNQYHLIDEDKIGVVNNAILGLEDIVYIEDFTDTLVNQGESFVESQELQLNYEEETSNYRNKLLNLQEEYKNLIKIGKDNWTEEQKQRFEGIASSYAEAYDALLEVYNKYDIQAPDDIIMFEEFANSGALGDGNQIVLNNTIESTNNKNNTNNEDKELGIIDQYTQQIEKLTLDLANATTEEEYSEIRDQINALQTKKDNLIKGTSEVEVDDDGLTAPEKSWIDKIGGWGNLLNAGLLAASAPALLKDIDVQEYPELSTAMEEHVRQAKELSKQGFSATEEAKVRQDIDTAYKGAITNLIRGTAGDRARFLAGSGIVDANRAKALLDFAAKDAELQRQNNDKYGELLQWKENYNYEKDVAKRNEELQMAIANKGSAAALASDAIKGFVQNIQDEKMYGKGSMIDMYYRGLIKEMGYDLGEGEKKLDLNMDAMKNAATTYNVNPYDINPETLRPFNNAIDKTSGNLYNIESGSFDIESSLEADSSGDYNPYKHKWQRKTNRRLKNKYNLI